MKKENQMIVSSATTDLTKFKSVEKLQSFLNTEPDKKYIRVNKMANGAKYLPINVIENMLDELTGGLWESYEFEWKIVANELGGRIIVKYYHPIAQVWLRRTGAAGTPIQMKSEKRGGTGDLSDINQKIKNTIVKDLPHLKSECLKNAAKSIAKSFGRDLNREIDAAYTQEALSDQIESYEPRQQEAYDLLDESPMPMSTKESVRMQISTASSKKLDSIITYIKSYKPKK